VFSRMYMIASKIGESLGSYLSCQFNGQARGRMLVKS
jgi:hypothetical protein